MKGFNMQKIVLILLLLVSTSAFSAERFDTNLPNVYVKNFSCSGSRATFNVVNKSNSWVTSVYINVFDADGDPIDKTEISSYIGPNSGKADSKILDCSKLSRIGFSAIK
jgi:uncharacterized protein YxeA